MESSGRVTFFCHQNADPDSACSAIGLQTLIRKIVPRVEASVVSPQGLSLPTRTLLQNLGLRIPLERVPLGKLGVAVLVDTNNLSQLGPDASKSILESPVPLVIVDHHHQHPEVQKHVWLEIVDSSSSSTAEIVALLHKVAGKKVDLNIAEALLAALFIETRSFTLANSQTFQTASYLARSGADPKRLPSLVNPPSSRGEKVARLKAASRLKLETIGDWLVGVSEVGSYQSSVARALVMIGADVAIVAGKVKGKIRVSLRATEPFQKRSGIHLGRDITIPLGTELDGSGGGHPTAAGMTVNGTVEVALAKCTDRLRALLSKRQVQG